MLNERMDALMGSRLVSFQILTEYFAPKLWPRYVALTSSYTPAILARPRVLSLLAGLAPVTAVRGNNDRGPWADTLPLTAVLKVESSSLYVVHDIGSLNLDPRAEGFQAVITGHSHKPLAEVRRGVLFLNPGSAGPRRFSLPVAVARIEVQGSSVSHKLINLAV
jgi:putative phosphoesterase